MPRYQNLPYETRLQLAITSVVEHRMTSRRAAEVYDVQRSTMYDRIKGRRPRSETRANSHRLDSGDETALIAHILHLDDVGVPLTLSAVRDAVNCFSFDTLPVSKRWAHRFVQRHPQLRARFSESDNCGHVLPSNLAAIYEWFQHYLETKARYEIPACNVYNMDGTVFQMETNTSYNWPERRSMLQPGNWETVSVILCVGAGGRDVPPFIILQGTEFLENWFSDIAVPANWSFALTADGMISAEKATDWLRHFDRHTAEHAHGGYRMLIIGSHESHLSFDFRTYCKDNKIVLLCVPSHASQLLQPLNVGLFSDLRTRFFAAIESYNNDGASSIFKTMFLAAFRRAYELSMSVPSITACFKQVGLFPYCPMNVIEKLTDSSVTTASSRPIEDSQRRTSYELDEIMEYRDSVYRALDDCEGPRELIKKYVAGLVNAVIVLHRHEQQLRAEVSRMKSANEEALNFDGLHASTAKVQRAPWRHKSRRCGICGQPGHNVRTCDASKSLNDNVSE